MFGLKLKWCKASSADSMTREGYNGLALHYEQLAKCCFRYRQDYVFEEILYGTQDLSEEHTSIHSISKVLG